jgi:hypothetical protein
MRQRQINNELFAQKADFPSTDGNIQCRQFSLYFQFIATPNKERFTNVFNDIKPELPPVWRQCPEFI